MLPAAPPVLKFDPDGNLLASWGGANAGQPWVKNEHGIHVDRDGNVWLGGNNDGDQILKFTPDGKFLQQIGKDDGTKGSASQTRLGRPAHMMTDPDANEIYVADGYGNHRIVVFDSKTGAFKRMWGAYGKPPSDDKLPAYKPDAKPSEQFANPVHCVRLSNDGLVYVCDRANNRIQVFRKDGTFVKEFRVTPETLANGSVWDLVLSEDAGQKFIFMADGANGQIVTLSRDTGDVAHAMGPPRPPARPVQVGPQHRHRFQGQSLYRRGRIRPPGAEIQEDAMIRTSVAVAALSLLLVSGAGAWNDILNSVWGPKGNDTGGIIPWSPENERNAFEIAAGATAATGTSFRWPPASTACPATTSPTSACGIRRASSPCTTAASM